MQISQEPCHKKQIHSYSFLFVNLRQLFDAKNRNIQTFSVMRQTDWGGKVWRWRLVKLWMSKQIPPSCSTEEPGWQHRGEGAKNQLGPVSQTISTAGAVCMDQQPTFDSSAIAFAGEMSKQGEPRSLKYCYYTTSSANGIYWFIWHNVNLWSCLLSVTVSKCGSKQTEIRLDTPVIPRRVCSLSEGATAKKKIKKEKKKKHTVKFFCSFFLHTESNSRKAGRN